MLPNNNVIVSATEPNEKDRKRVWIQIGKNLYNGVKNIGLLTDSGTIQSNNDWFTSDFIEVKHNTKYTLSYDATGEQQWKVCYYNTNNECLSFEYGNTTGNYSVELITPINCSKLRFGLRENLNCSNVQLECGDQTSYEAYLGKK